MNSYRIVHDSKLYLHEQYLHDIAKDSDYIVTEDDSSLSAVERFTQQNETVFAVRAV